MSHVPNPTQVTNLANLKAAQVTAAATLVSAQASLVTAQAAYVSAAKATKDYEAYINGGKPVGAIDIGTQDA